MRVITLCVAAMILSVAIATAVPFTPTLLKLSAPGSIRYDFTGKDLNIPFTVSGTPAIAVFFVYTKGKGELIGKVKNGYLGWHYVNKIDTCVYMSAPKEYTIGNQSFTWSGKNLDGAIVPADTYTYYFWGFDGMSAKTLACNAVSVPQDMSGGFECYDNSNKPLANPIFHPSGRGTAPVSPQTDPPTNRRAKWVLGGDPQDSTLIETTYFTGWSNQGKLCPMPGDHKKYFVHSIDSVNALQIVRKYTWVPNGQSEQDLKWGENGMYTFNNINTYEPPGPLTDNIDGLWVICAPHRSPREVPTEMHYIDYTDGSRIRVYDFARTWQNDEEYAKCKALNLTVQQGPRMGGFYYGLIFMASNQHCLKECINPYAEDDAEVVVWDNSNGDNVGDRNFQPDAGTKAWLCQGASSAGWVYDSSADANHFMIANQYDLGNISFCAFGPDGRGVGNFSFSGETAKIKFGILTVDSGSAFDGMYMDNNPALLPGGPFPGLWFIGQDSIKGVIGTEIGVADTKPSSFSVAQNVPNPFNPTTAISFSIPNAGKVTVEVYNAAGQKVATVLNASLSAGNHSVVWNASGFSAGVYFYTVKAGTYAKTLKMTLIK